jgi:hypothetical protein
MGAWLAQNWFNILSALGIVASLLFTAISLRSETRTRRVGNLLTLTQNHRELWSELFDRPTLRRVLETKPDLSKSPITLDEDYYVNMLIQHLGSAFQAMRSGLTIKPEGLKEDVRRFFSLPIPRAIWEKLKVFQNDEFVRFVDECLRIRKASG